jgi:predicted CopG family antitoxin
MKKGDESFSFVRSRWLHEEERRNISTRSNTASTSEEEGKRKAA